MPPEICPQCGEEVPARARACPACGSDERTGWSEEAAASRLGLPDDSFDHEEFVRRELGSAGLRPRGVSGFWWLAAILVLIAFLTLLF